MALSDTTNDAYAYIQEYLNNLGLGSLSRWALDQLIQGHSSTIISQLLFERPEFKTRFPAYFERQAKGLTPISIAQIIDYENRSRQLMHAVGIPYSEMYSNQYIQQRIADDVSLTEFSDRLTFAAERYYSTDPLIRQEQARLFNSPVLSAGEEMAMILDPDIAFPVIQRQYAAASIGATALRTGYGMLTQEQAALLESRGITPQQAQQGFNTLAQSRELFSPIAGELGSGTVISPEQQLAAQFYGSASDQDSIERQRERRLAQGQGRTAYTSSARGVTGLTPAST